MIKKIEFASHDEWLAIRRQYIGGSDAGAIVGMNPYKSAYALWAEKTGKVAEFEGNIITKVGAYLEELVAKMFEEETDKKVRRCNFTLVNDEYPWAEANVDRMVVGEDAILEIKTTNSLPNMRMLKGGEFPDAWYCQMTHYLAVTGKAKAYLAVLVNCREFKIFELERDEEEIKSLMAAESRFWDCVKNNVPPALDGTESTSDTIKALYPESDGSECNLMAFGSKLQRYSELGERIKDLKAEQDLIANEIKEYMGASAKGECDGYKVTYTSSERKTFDTKRFTAAHPGEDLSEFYKVTSVRTFKVTERK